MIFITNNMGWPSEHTRGYQIADALGCKVNEPIKSLDETVVAVKTYLNPELNPNMDKMTNLYYDFIDDSNMVQAAKRYPYAKIIVLTDLMKQVVGGQIKNEIVILPEHSCNFEQAKRDRDEVKVVGYVGSRDCFDLDSDEITDVLKQMGLEFKFLICETDKVTRKDVCEFYKTIDIQLAYRLPEKDIRPDVYRNPLKIFNAGSFGIPTVAFPEIAYRFTASTYFLEASSLDAIVSKCYCLKNDKKLYEFYSNRVFNWSKQFDIAKVAERYAKLSPNETFDIKNNVKRMRGAA